MTIDKLFSLIKQPQDQVIAALVKDFTAVENGKQVINERNLAETLAAIVTALESVQIHIPVPET